MMGKDKLGLLTNEIEQGFMQRGGWAACRHLLGKPCKPCCQESQRLQAAADVIEELRTSGDDCTIEINGPGECLRVFGAWTEYEWLEFKCDSVPEALRAVIEAKRKMEKGGG